jgi:hypothetical protein
MRILIKILQELVSLFVDDGTLAATILVWIMFYGLMLPLVPTGFWQGPILFVGLAAILIENTRRGATSHSG